MTHQALVKSILKIMSLTTLGLLVGCTFDQKYPDKSSILIVAVSNLRADSIGCGTVEDSLTPHLDKICAESVRFTHAYTPSVMTNAALASLLTGLYPVEHGVRNNGASRYVENVRSLPQAAAEIGYETFFVSGGPPVLRKSAVAKGFTDFDDSIRRGGQYYRPADQVVNQFVDLLDSRGGFANFFSVLFFADLQFPDAVVNLKNQKPDYEGSENGKLQIVDDAIGALVSIMKKKKIWDQLTVVVVGLHGRAKSEHEILPVGFNLYDEVVRVPLIIKPSRKPRDLAPQWNVDNSVTLADLGHTLFEMLGVKDFKTSQYSTLSLIPALQAKDIHDPDRVIFTESDLPSWRGWGPRMVLLRLGEWVYWPSKNETKIYNSYTDRMQIHNLFGKDFLNYKKLDDLWQTFKARLSFIKEDLPTFTPYSIIDKVRTGKTLFFKNTTLKEKYQILNELTIRRPDDWQVHQWMTSVLREMEDWPTMNLYLKKKEPSNSNEKIEYQTWLYLLQQKIKNIKKINLPPNKNIKCLSLVHDLNSNALNLLEGQLQNKVCEDKEIEYWLRAFMAFKNRQNKDVQTFTDAGAAITFKRIDQLQFAKAHWVDGVLWDFSTNIPAGPALFELFLSLNTNKEFQDFMKRQGL